MSLRATLLKALIRDARARTQIVYPWELPSIMRKHIVTGAMGTVYFTLMSGIYLVAFGNNLGMQYWQWGLLSTAASFGQVLQLVSAHAVRRVGYRRSMWFWPAVAGRTVRACAVVAAFALADLSAPASRLTFVGLLVLANCFDAVSAPPWFSWLADIVPRETHGRFMGRRSAWIAVANLSVVVPIGFLVDRYGGRSSSPALLCVFALGFGVGMLDLFVHRTIPEPQMAKPPKTPFVNAMLLPLQDAGFRPWLVFNGVWTFGMTLGGSLATIYFVENLGVRRNFLGGSVVLILLPLVATVLTARWAGGLVDRHGIKAVLRWGHRVWAVLPLFWIVARPEHALLWLGLAAVCGSIGSGAALNAAGKFVTRLRSPENVPMYVAVSTCVGALAGGMGPLVAGPFLQLTRDASWAIGNFTVEGFHMLFAASFMLRATATLLIRRIPEVRD